MGCNNEYGTLKKVIVCEPKFMTIPDTIEEAQRHLHSRAISIDMAMKQHRHFVSVLKEHNVKVIYLKESKQYPEQVFTRDIGFALGKNIFIANMEAYLRKGEEVPLKTALDQIGLNYQTLQGPTIEGGDVIIDGDTVFVGLSNRTTEAAVKQLQSLLPEFTVMPIPFTDSFLHLDCVFNVLSPTDALIYPEEIHGGKIKYLESKYNLIEVSQEEQATLGTNVLSIGNKRVISLPVNKTVNKQLRALDYEVIEVDLSEIIKAGGAFRCCTLPLLRE